MKWPWQKAPENRGTLTLLPSNRIVLGLPRDYSTDEMADVLGHALQQWNEEGQPRQTLVFPFPIDVVDQRR